MTIESLFTSAWTWIAWPFGWVWGQIRGAIEAQIVQGCVDWVHATLRPMAPWLFALVLLVSPALTGCGGPRDLTFEQYQQKVGQYGELFRALGGRGTLAVRAGRPAMGMIGTGFIFVPGIEIDAAMDLDATRGVPAAVPAPTPASPSDDKAAAIQSQFGLTDDDVEQFVALDAQPTAWSMRDLNSGETITAADLPHTLGTARRTTSVGVAETDASAVRE